MKSLLPLATAVALTMSGSALASDDCHSPMADWKSRDTVAAFAKDLGISSERMRIDDGCYEVRGRDADGNRVELKIEPATLAIMELEVRFRPGADTSRYLSGAKPQASQPPAPAVSGAAVQPATPTRAEIN